MPSTHSIASFSQLPAEIYLIILAYTPIKGILTCRLLTRNLKSIVDNEKNRELLARQRIDVALDHLHTTVNNLNQSIFNLPILEALQVFIANRGLQADPQDRLDDARAFASHRVGHMAAMGANGGGSNYQVEVDTASLAIELIERHVQRHLPHILNYHPLDGPSLRTTGTRHSALQNVQMSEEELLATLARVKATQTPGGILKGAVHTRRRSDINGFPRFPLTPLRCAFAKNASRQKRFQGFCTVLELVDLFDVPDIGDEGNLAYCTERAWVYSKVQQVVFGARLSLLEKAAVVEEIWVY
ncbi:hypothetical protein AC578_8721 [Pseudocercospora eumusae]|uniref:F-box domain-containing protein n=1 Tax=Pseudocercospora eumusae TaxID=321146 RepID=A0A139HQ41_9PEZI|nr:hypothetical protein AC578_8721 [Pseudocercospora eumusae]KXT04606.1 hypothetical protein AC578_8721 [Pseudocercospora eumusae]